VKTVANANMPVRANICLLDTLVENIFFLTLIIKNAYNLRHFVAHAKLTNINDINQYKLTIFW